MAPHPAEPLERAVAEGVFPAAALVASRGGGEPLAVYAGEAGPDTRFDLASLTKVLYTTAAAMVLVSDGRLDPEAPAEKLLPEWALGATVRVRHLLHHESGLPWWRPLYEEVGAPGDGPRDAALRRAMLRAALALPPEAEPEARAEYSDPGFIVLEQVCERAAGGPLPALVAERVWVPLGLRTTGFVDLTVPGAREAARAEAPHAPTEDCPWRGRRLVAEVHDHNAHALGGVAGHAGLFGTAWDVHAFGAGVLRALEGRGPLPGDVVARFCGERGRAPGTSWNAMPKMPVGQSPMAFGRRRTGPG